MRNRKYKKLKFLTGVDQILDLIFKIDSIKPKLYTCIILFINLSNYSNLHIYLIHLQNKHPT